ncbi:DUF397 domain-containing protein [Nocardia jejuensis]|uniref:DUF397 domain-containing protein n=1 Tax=Nocardia jejuensis TaxID=328049 RepID=UPI000A06D8A9|nr:DUF397 domain-containing protein [Nocardia jejuensis]
MTDHDAPTWRKATASNNGGACVEVRFEGESVLIRDSKYLRDATNDPAEQPTIAVPNAAWPEFLDRIPKTSEWFKSTHSDHGAACVEVRFDGTSALLRDSKYLRDPSNDPKAHPTVAVPLSAWPEFLSRAADTLEFPGAEGVPSIERTSNEIVLRDAQGTTLRYTSKEWTAFIAGVCAGEFAHTLV